MELPAEMQDVLQAAGVREVAMAPIVVRGSVWGVLSAGALDERDFETSELDLLAGIADLTGLGLGAAGAAGVSPSTA
jgi:GAF domain-containing protein